MTRNIKTMGLALIAILATSAIVASTASATNDVLTTPNGGTTTLTGGQESGAGTNKFKIVGQSSECTTMSAHAAVTGTSSTQITVTPSYSGCTLAGIPVTFDMNGCKYVFTGNTNVNGHAQVHIEDCDTDKHITITLTGMNCDITLKEAGATDGNQTNVAEGIKFTNIGSGTTAEVTIDLTIKPKLTVDTWPEGASSALCAEMEPATTGRLTGSITVTGSAAGAHVPVSIS